jgi:hypothetical protein
MTTPEYEQGVVAGRIEQRLAQHDDHFDKINGSMQRLADEMHNLALSTQRLGDSVVADRATALVTAEALKNADIQRREKAEQSWTPLAKAITILLAVAAITGAILAAVKV